MQSPLLLFFFFVLFPALLTHAGICLYPNTSLALGADYMGVVTPPTNGLAVEGNTELGCSTSINKLDVNGGVAIGNPYACTNTAPSNGALIKGNMALGCTNSLNKIDCNGGVAVGSSYACTATAPSNGAIIQGQVGIGTSSPNTSLILDVTSTTQAMAGPRMNTTQVNAISNPPDGSEVYDNTVLQFKGRVNGAWLPFFNGGYQFYADVKTSGTDGGTSTTTTWVNRTLNTAVAGNLDGVFTSLSNNLVTIQPGTYIIQASAPAQSAHIARLYSATTESVVVLGTSEYVTTASLTAITRSHISYSVTLTSATTYRIQHYVSSGVATNGFGRAVSASGTTEMYTRLEIWKIA